MIISSQGEFKKPVLQSAPDQRDSSKPVEVGKLLSRKKKWRKTVIENMSLLFSGPFKSPKP